MAIFKTKGDKLFIDGKEVLKGWESFSGWYWFGTELAYIQDSLINEKTIKDDPVWFGFVQGLEEEWGYFSQSEIESLGKYRVWPIKAIDLPHAGRRS